MDYLPLFTRVSGAHCIVVGGGTVALRKAGALVRAGARVTAVAPEVCDELKALCRDSGGAVRERAFTGDDLDQAHGRFTQDESRSQYTALWHRFIESD